MEVLGALSLAAWLALLALPRPTREDGDAPDPTEWPPVCAIVPARNEAAVLPKTLRALLDQDYPGPFRVVVVDDRSEDGTARVARELAAELVEGRPLPEGWVGKVWALEQGRARAGDAVYLLLTDADIRHAPGSLRRLVAESEAHGLALNSRMARLRCVSWAERLLIPAFLFFFNLLYPMRWANAGRRPAAAGGCILLRGEAIDGFAAMRDAVIDDIALARTVEGRIRLALSESDVVSVRDHPHIRDVWRMVRRTAFAQLRYSRSLAALTVLALALLFAVPPALTVTGSILGASAWFAMALAYLPTIRYFGRNPLWALSLPIAGILYAAMTLDSATAPPGSAAPPRPS